MATVEQLDIDDTGLTDQEKEQLRLVMERAKQFDKATAEALAAPPKGLLSKWTNAFRGWQPRWFTVDQTTGILNYYMAEDRQKQPPRGSLQLWGAMVAPSEEDSQTFTVSASNGEVYKLKGSDARDRQYWVSRLRREVEAANSKNSKEQIQPNQTSQSQSSNSQPEKDHLVTPKRQARNRFSISSRRKPANKPAGGKEEEFPGGDAMREAFTRLQTYQHNVDLQFDSYASQAGLNPLDRNVLLLRASSKAAVATVKDCLSLLRVNYKDPDLISTKSASTEKLSGSLSGSKTTLSSQAQTTNRST